MFQNRQLCSNWRQFADKFGDNLTDLAEALPVLACDLLPDTVMQMQQYSSTAQEFKADSGPEEVARMPTLRDRGLFVAQQPTAAARRSPAVLKLKPDMHEPACPV